MYGKAAIKGKRYPIPKAAFLHGISLYKSAWLTGYRQRSSNRQLNGFEKTTMEMDLWKRSEYF